MSTMINIFTTKMSFSFSINPKSQSNRFKRPAAASVFDAAKTDSSAVTYVSEFRADGAPPPPDSKIKPIAPLPNELCRNKKLKNLPTLPQISQSNGGDSALQFELDPGSNPEPSDSSIGFGLNLREPSATGCDVPNPSRGETILDLDFPEDSKFDDFDDVPVEEFRAAMLSRYGWKEGRGIVKEVRRKAWRGSGGIGFTGELPGSNINNNGNAGDDLKKKEDMKGKKGYGVWKEVRIVNGREMGMKGKIVEVRDGGDVLFLRLSKVKIRTRDVAEVGSSEEEKCLRKVKELKVRTKNVDDKDRNLSRTRERKEEMVRTERVNWLRNHIRVRVINQKLKGGRLYLKKGVIVDVVGPGVCDISIDQSNELVQGVDQEFLETALPKRGGPVIVLYGRHKGVYGNLLERDSEKEMGVVRDADTHELLNVKLEEIAEYTGDPSDIGY